MSFSPHVSIIDNSLRNSYIAKSLIGIIWVVDVSAILKIDMNFNFRTDIKVIFESDVDIATSAGNIS